MSACCRRHLSRPAAAPPFPTHACALYFCPRTSPLCFAPLQSPACFFLPSPRGLRSPTPLGYPSLRAALWPRQALLHACHAAAPSSMSWRAGLTDPAAPLSLFSHMTADHLTCGPLPITRGFQKAAATNKCYNRRPHMANESKQERRAGMWQPPAD